MPRLRRRPLPVCTGCACQRRGGRPPAGLTPRGKPPSLTSTSARPDVPARAVVADRFADHRPSTGLLTGGASCRVPLHRGTGWPGPVPRRRSPGPTSTPRRSGQPPPRGGLRLLTPARNARHQQGGHAEPFPSPLQSVFAFGRRAEGPDTGTDRRTQKPPPRPGTGPVQDGLLAADGTSANTDILSGNVSVERQMSVTSVRSASRYRP